MIPTIDFKELGVVSKAESKPINKKPIDKLEKDRLIKLPFGKYNEKTLGEIFNNDRRYFDYLKNKGQDPSLINACKYLENQMVN